MLVIYRAWYNERSICVTPSEREFRKETHEAYVVIGKQSQQRREVGVVILFHLPYLYIDPSLRSRRAIFQKVEQLVTSHHQSAGEPGGMGESGWGMSRIMQRRQVRFHDHH